MGNKIFVSYKFNDKSVYPLNGIVGTKVRDYVDIIEQRIDLSYHICKGESNDEDLSGYKESYIWELLKPRIYDSSVTIVIISPNMMILGRSEKSQWIPWEISYSLKEISRSDRTSHSNAVFSVVLPDVNNSYCYYIKILDCCEKGCDKYNNEEVFPIISSNTLNKYNMNYKYCCNGLKKHIEEGEEPSYIFPIRWNYFINNINFSVNRAIKLRNNIYNYNITKEVLNK
jgi:hypothetical protein